MAKFSPFGWLVSAALVLGAGVASATVTQVDGQIVPQGNQLQNFLDDPLNGEMGTIDAILDAAKVPEVFLPNTFQPVVFLDVAEGAGFENSFGWYNVGDDVFTPAGMARNLHPIMGCGGNTMTNAHPIPPLDADLLSAAHNQHHHGDPSMYQVDAEPRDTVSVDFAAEMAAGRYKGGFIGFYLITPEDNGPAGNCGDFLRESDGDSYFGRIYYTQADLNNDGDFVHHLVYSSTVVTDRFYFGFEDLFRGGDNDFEDMLMQVTGLTPPCTPQAEICDGIDNDCDGLVDNADPSLTGVGQPCQCDGSGGLTCQGGNRQGACVTGQTVCNLATIECQSTVSPTGETCNNVDDNCNGVVDDNPAGTGPGFPCDGPDGDLCNEGDMECVSGVLQCGDNTTTNTETCDGNDDDCDGTVDENPAGVGAACDGGDLDLCNEGTIECTGGSLTCNDNTGTNQESCNNLDDDCDGTTDENSIDVGGACSAGIGACQRNGVFVCQSGVPTCNATPGSSSSEQCNGADDDCDTLVDESFNVGQACMGVGACGPGVLECAGLTGTRCSTNPGGSNDQSSAETCNGIDDDCDGNTDEGLNNLGSCGTNQGECQEGTLRCIGGSPVCQGDVGPTPEVCDGLNNDCDTATDESPVDEGQPCGATDVGVCEFGTTVCNTTTGMLECQNEVTSGAETCNNLDDDCDGITDNNLTDTGGSCGASNTGQCSFGNFICTNGSLVCAGEVGPTVEVCDSADNDCDGTTDENPVDVGIPCGSGSGVCTPGLFECQAGARVCVGASGGTAETCDGQDNDCDNIIDENPPGVDQVCGQTMGVCEPGLTKCIQGSMECVGGILPTTEQCNGIDDDCDGNMDEGDLCSGGVCLDGTCSVPCMPGEFQCPLAQICENDFCVPDPCFGITCPDVDGNKHECQAGTCVPVCDNITCPGELVCRGRDGLCVPDNCHFLPDKCAAGEVCLDSACTTDSCADVSCSADQFCRDGNCIGSCADVTCDVGQECKDGQCVSTGCDVNCPDGRICNNNTGNCEPDGCEGINCGVGQVCDPGTNGTCIPDVCTTITCPEGQDCRRGDCFAPPSNQPDAGVEEKVYAAGGGGCSIGGDGDDSSTLLLIGLAVLVLGVGRKRVRRVALPTAAAALSAGLLLLGGSTGCNVDPFCLNCETGGNPIGDGDGGINNPDAGDTTPDATSVSCDAGVLGTEICDGEDNDCDGTVDEGFNFDADPLHCGACNTSCLKSGTTAECNSGQCEITGCIPGSVDLNDDIGGPFDQSDGCEYGCFVSNGGTEVCDGLDNDCNGNIDENTDFQTDSNNCGSCGTVCAAFMANVSCTTGSCSYDPATDCVNGFVDANMNQLDGCEYQCTPSNGGTEQCDYLDNDCDGSSDEGFNLASDVNNCGQCGRTCGFPNVDTPQCSMSMCFFDPMTGCTPGFVDANGVQLDGCEYPCTVTNMGVETCDGVDNDCNGIVDDSPMGTGGSCNNAPGGTAEGECTETGTLTCVNANIVCAGAPTPQNETCDGNDNDCDGTTDEEVVDAGGVCQAAVGVCSAGINTCNLTTGMLECVRAIGPGPETCNGLDDDCNGTPDDNLTDPGLGMSCGTDTGPCVAGILTCTNGALECAGETPPQAETCNGADDNCNGTPDDSPIDAGNACGTSAGACVQGTEVCSMGGLVCQGGQGPVGETCNNTDDDCDGTTDEVPGAPGGGPITASCYSGSPGTAGVGECIAGTSTCTAGVFGACSGEVVDTTETCDGDDNDCDMMTDENLTQGCYTGSMMTRGVGECRDGVQSCIGGTFSGSCVGEVTPTTETCDGADNDCDGNVDEGVGGAPLTRSCYTGTPSSTENQGVCVGGTQTCAFGSYGVCNGEVTPTTDVCGDGLDTDCDTLDDAGEGCFVLQSEVRLDAPGGSQGSGAGAEHSFDVEVASSGNNIYVVWSDNTNGASDVFFRRSTNGGSTWENIVTLTSSGGPGSTGEACVKPKIVAAGNNVYIAYQRVDGGSDERELRVFRSTNSGATWSEPNSPSNGRLDNGGDSFHHDIATNANGTHVTVVWEQLNTTTLARTIVARVSTDSGNNWDGRRTINVNSGSNPVAGRPQAAITSTNRYVYVWREVRSPGTTFDIFMNYSDDGTTAISGSNEVRLDNDTGDNRNSDFPQMVNAEQSLYVIWQDISTTPGGGSDAVFARSSNNGSAWGSEIIVDDPSGEVSSSFAPVIALDPGAAGNADDRVYAAWIDDREGTQVYSAVSANGGSSFGTPVRASSSSNVAIAGVTRQPRIAFVGNNTVVVAYTNNLGGQVDHVFAAASIDGGATWQITHFQLDTGAGPGADPNIAPTLGGGVTRGAIVTWIDNRAGSQINGDVYARRVGN